LQRNRGEGRFVTDPTLLMRFSAATANAHRIHYDWPYATGVEGYPGPIVHGPLSTLVLAEALRLSASGQRVVSLKRRNLAPLFCWEDATVPPSHRAHSGGDAVYPSGRARCHTHRRPRRRADI
jgi:3-methylfumaryl-CoA hydratase